MGFGSNLLQGGAFMESDNSLSRRGFIRAATGAATFMIVGAEAVRGTQANSAVALGWIGLGGRGTADARGLAAAGGRVVALADVFQDRVDTARKTFTVEDARCFLGFDGYKRVCDLQLDAVILTTPPGFRPLEFKAAVDAGKHVFMEKPAGVDPQQIKSIIASGEVADKKGLAVVAGTQRRHQLHYVDILKRVQDGAIGEILSAQVYWCGGDMLGYWKWWDRENMAEMEWQCRSWPWFVWTSGDHMVEQHVHNLDIANWALGAHPVSAYGMGGRAVRKLGNIWDHFAVEYEYPGGIRVLSMCRQINGCADRVSEHLVGTKGTVYTDSQIGRIEGATAYEYKGPNPNPYVQEHADLIASIRAGKPLNEAKRVAESTLTAILGRMSAYTGRQINWDWAVKSSKLDLTPPKYDLKAAFPVEPVAVPGVTQLT